MDWEMIFLEAHTGWLAGSEPSAFRRMEKGGPKQTLTFPILHPF